MREIKLTQGKVALVDDEDFEYLNQFRWCAAKNGKTFYAIRKANYNGKWITERMHRVLCDIPSGKEVDHIDHNGLNNQKDNLRVVTRQENKFNASAWGQSKYLGVSIYNENGRKYIAANIWRNGKKKFLGFFPTEEAAALAYNKAASEFQGEFANLNKTNKQ